MRKANPYSNEATGADGRKRIMWYCIVTLAVLLANPSIQNETFGRIIFKQ